MVQVGVKHPLRLDFERITQKIVLYLSFQVRNRLWFIHQVLAVLSFMPKVLFNSHLILVRKLNNEKILYLFFELAHYLPSHTR